MSSLPFANRAESGRALADELARRGIGRNAVVLGLARGGIPVGFEVADRLHRPLDVIVARKIGVPWQPELAMGAIAGSVQMLDRRTIDQLRIAAPDIEKVVADERALIRNYEERYRLGEPPLDLQGKTALLVDDGLATGSTMMAAARYARSLNAAKVVVAVPVGSEDGCARLRAELDELICLAVPHDFSAVSEWYRDFRQTSDAEVQDLLAENRRRFGKCSVIPGDS